MHTVKLFDGTSFQVTDQEAAAVAHALNDGKQKAVTLQGSVILLSAISAILKQDKIEEGNDHKIGVLHDGTKVFRQFGEWFCLNGDYDGKGRYEVRPDPMYYPEVTMDCVPSIKEFEFKYAQLPIDERKALMYQNKDLTRYTRSGGLTRISSDVAGLLE